MRTLNVALTVTLSAALGAARLAAAGEKPAAAQAAEGARLAVKRLCSFEPEEMAHLLPGVKQEETDNLYKAYRPAHPIKGIAMELARVRLAPAYATDGTYCMVNRAYNIAPGTWEEIGVVNQYARCFGMNWVRGVLKSPDWRGYDYLWLDVTSPNGDAMPWLFIEEARTFGPYARFKVPKGQTVTLALPLAAAVEWSKKHGEGELNLGDMYSIYYFDEAGQRNITYLDNLRLATKAAPRPANLVEPFDYLGADMGRLEESAKVPPAPKRNFPRESGPVEPLGPITLPHVEYRGWSGHLGAFGEGGDYGTANICGVAAYDNRRIAVQAGYLFATFDGGKTWGSLDGKPNEASRYPGGGHAGMGGCYYSGDFYALIRTARLKEACNGGTGITRYDMIPIFFQGESWQVGPRVIFDHHYRHCPYYYPIVFQCKSGRVWAFSDGGLSRPTGDQSLNFLWGYFAKYSDDGGITWRSPGPYPQQVVPVVGEMAVPYKDQVAVFGTGAPHKDTDYSWQFYDAKAEKFQTGLTIPGGNKFAVVAAAGTGDALLAALAPVRATRTSLTVACLVGDTWRLDQLDDGSAGQIGPVSMTASGEKAFCFWFRKEMKDGKESFALLYALWGPKTGWGKPLEITREADAVHRIVVPVVSPPDYAPVFWDKLTPRHNDAKTNYPWVRFARVPSDRPWKPAATNPGDSRNEGAVDGQTDRLNARLVSGSAGGVRPLESSCGPGLARSIVNRDGR
ncbi:MAG: hypothetical protein AMS14_09090 [Planctomycetes bacterium DG_20]|nr:MAG: hypothetical protein AMS14_09090 [Planctomycetes bacterium DG_20]